jgi:hypothetical protein
MKHARYILYALLLAPLLACRISAGIEPTPTIGPTSTPANTPPQTATPTAPTLIAADTPTPISPSPTAGVPTISASSTPLPPPPIPIYHIIVSFDVASHIADVSETIHYTNRTGEALTELMLITEPARQEGVFSLKQITWPGGLQAGNFRMEGSFWYLPLAAALQPGAEIEIGVRYELTLPVNGGVLGYTGRQVNFGDWYPFIPPYLPGTGWLAYATAPVGEHLVFEKADFDVTIRVIHAPAGWKVIAPGLADLEADVYHFGWENARSFAWSGSEQYVFAEGVFDGVNIRQYTFPQHARKGEDALQVMGKALMLYQELFGPYPHDQLIAIEGDFFDGMEYDGLFFLGEEYFLQHDGNPTGYLTALSAHETAHQWWYGVVGNDQAWEPWLDEALCTYSEYLYYERYAPEHLAWWWEFRSDRFQPTGWVNSTIYDHTSFRSYVDAVYLRGAHLLDDLRTQLGDESFFAILKMYATRQAGQIATGKDFFAILKEYASKDYQIILDQYFRYEP